MAWNIQINHTMAPQSPSDRDTNNIRSKDPKNEGYRHLTPEAIQGLKDFQYNGADHSLIYKYILSPLAGFLVDHATPSKVAPNTITLFGFSFMIVALLLIQHHCPSFDQCTPENNVPGYIFLVNGLALLIYQTLDNMDGKHARKTNSSSPLGLFFDHGLDACNVFIGTVNTICLLGIGTDDLVSIAVITFMTSFAFYVTTWEEYYTHKLELPIINGPSEGVLSSALMSLGSWYFGQQIWHAYSFNETMVNYLPSSILELFPGDHLAGGYSNLNFFCVFLTAMTMREAISKITFVVRNYGIKTIIGLAPLLALMALSTLIVLSDGGAKVFIQHQRLSLYIFGVTFVEMTTALMLAHMSKMQYDPFRNTICPLFILYTLVDLKVPMTYVEPFMMVHASLISSFVIVKTKAVIREMCNALGIWCFDIVTPHPNDTRSDKKNK